MSRAYEGKSENSCKIPHKYPNLIKIPIEINNQNFLAMLDTGSSISLINFNVLSQLKIQPQQCSPSVVSYGNNSKGVLNHCAHLSVYFKNSKTDVTFYPVDLAYDVLLGLDFCFNSSIVIMCDPDKRLVSCLTNKELKKALPINAIHIQPEISVIYLTNNVAIEPETVQLITLRNSGISFGTALFEPYHKNLDKYSLLITRCLVNFIDYKCEVYIYNFNPFQVVLHEGTRLGFVDFSEAEQTPSMSISTETKSEFDIDPNLKEEEAFELHKLLNDYNSVFASKKKINVTSNVKHRIIVDKDTQPIHQAPYRVSPAQREIIQKQVTEMVEDGIIQPSDSPWASPIILVRKKNGAWRFCIDFRKLNSVTKKDVYPLPRIDDTLDLLSGSSYFSTLDLAQAFWQIELAPEDREKTAFITGEGLYEFRRMPFGLVNAPATMQRLINSVLKSERWKICLTYLDDIIVFSKTFSEQVERLETVLKALQKANLQLQKTKCKFAYKEVVFLGHLISEKGISPDPAKTDTIEKFPPPKNIKQVRSFLGLASYYRRFIKNFSSIAHPLNELLKKDNAFCWTEKCQKAFQELKEKLITPPILIHFNDKLPIFLYTDASGFAIGAVLAHKIDNIEHVVAYISHSLNKHEQNYPITEKECLAIVYSVEKFKPYLYGRHFTVVTDHHPLCYLNSTRSPSGRLSRWAVRLSEYSFDILHKKGECHKNADCLSRYPTTTFEYAPDDHLVYSLENVDLISSQNQDEWCARLKSKLTPKQKKHGFIVIDNILYRMVPTNEGQKQLLCLPLSLVDDICKEFHDSPLSGHLGVKRTFQKIRSRFYRPKLPMLVQKYVQSCHICQRRNTPPLAPQGFLQSSPLSDPFEVVSIDFLGPLTQTSRQNRHIIVLTDLGTRWAIAKAVRDATAENVSKFLLESVFLKHGFPKQLISDRGTQFLSQIVENLLKQLSVKHTPTTSYHPQCNGLCERFNKTLCDILSKYVNENQNNWDVLIPYALFAYNTAKQDSTNETPFRLVYGRDPILPIDNTLNLPNNNKEIRNSIDKIRKEVKDRLERSNIEQSIHYDKKRRSYEYAIGDLVLVYMPTREVGKSTKLLSRWVGPFSVLKKTSPVNYQLKDVRKSPGRKLIDTYPVARMKKYYLRQPSPVIGPVEESAGLPDVGSRKEPITRKFNWEASDLPEDVEVRVDKRAPVVDTPATIPNTAQAEGAREEDRTQEASPHQHADHMPNSIVDNERREFLNTRDNTVTGRRSTEVITSDSSGEQFDSLDAILDETFEDPPIQENAPQPEIDTLCDRMQQSFRPASHSVPSRFSPPRSVPQAPRETVTRYGRKSKPPERYGNWLE